MANSTIWKFPFDIAGDFELEMPDGARILAVQSQTGIPCLWAACDPAAPKVKRRFRLAGTGHQTTFDGLEHVGTFQMADGALVWHLFDAGIA